MWKSGHSTFGVLPFLEAHATVDISAVTKAVMVSMVTEKGANMVESVITLNLSHALCVAHLLNLVVNGSLDATLGLENFHTVAREVTALFKISTTKGKAQKCAGAVESSSD